MGKNFTLYFEILDYNTAWASVHEPLLELLTMMVTVWFQAYCTPGHFLIGDITGDILSLTADGKHLLWHEWIGPDEQ